MDSEYDGKDEKMAERTQVKQKKALILLPYLKNGDGTAVALMNYYQELIEHGWRIDFLVLKIFECEWLNKVKADGNNIYELPNADYVCTDSFHCTAFSIQYEKNFTVFHRFEKKDKNSTNTRLYSLLEQLNLGTRIIDDGQDIIPNAVDYSICNNLLEKQRVISSEYLQEALRARKKF